MAASMTVKSATRVAQGQCLLESFMSLGNTQTIFAAYLPDVTEFKKLPVVYWLSGLTCTDENFSQKAGAFQAACDNQVVLVMPDTSPRGDGVPDEEYDFVVKELPALVEAWPVTDKRAISGHSMGGHGALTIGLKNPDRYTSVSAFAPICNPTKVPWGQKAFKFYLGSDEQSWKQYDATELISEYKGPTVDGKDLHILCDCGTALTPASVPASAICQALLLTSWADKVCGQVAHRKYLEDLASIDVTATTCVAHLLPSERALLIPQRLGAFYSGEFTKHFAPEASNCPLCGASDSRLHRVAACPRVLQLRATFPRIHHDWDSLAVHTQAFGLWPELDTFRPWQASLDAMTLPSFVRTVDTAPVALYTDGSCLHPRTPLCRIAAYAVVQAGPDGRLLHTAAGPLPGSHQTPFRAELLALGIAFALHSRPWVFTDCSAVAKRANRLLSAKRSGRPLALPTEHTDLWTFFVLQLDAVDLQHCRIEWIPSHRDWSQCQGVQRVHAWFNDWADKAAKAALSHHRTPLYESHLAAWSARQPLVHELARFHAAAALMFTQETSPAVDPPPVQVSAITLLGPPSFCALAAEFPPPSRHPSFTRDLARWLVSKPWVPSAQVPGMGLLNDMSWLELFWVFLWDTRGYPPFQFQGSWVCLSDDPVLYFALPCAWSLFRSFRSFLGSLLKAGVSRPWGHELSQVSSASFLGARFPCAGFPGRVEASLGAIRSLCDILAGCPKVSALRLPFV
eukprot:Skav204931  [mRNA]  locus=scaffold2514:31829:42585:+ [translate_table: standard]